jgi:hypothetical protein
LTSATSCAARCDTASIGHARYAASRFGTYSIFGWHEGRDPSVGFDTTSYLAAYADVNAAPSIR